MMDSPLLERTRLLKNRLREEASRLPGGERGLELAEPYMETLRRHPAFCHYKYVAPAAREICGRLAELGGAELLEAIHRILLASLVHEQLEKKRPHDFPGDIPALIAVNFERIIAQLEKGQYKPGYYNYPEDKFNKDLSICRTIMVPLGAQKIYAGRLSRGFVFRGGLLQFFRACKMVALELGGIKPIYRMHTDSRDRHLMSEFNPDGWVRFYLRTAEMLKKNPDVRGLCGTSWFWDPVLKEVSPEIAYLRETALACGARIFRQGAGDGAVKDAIFMNRKRAALYEEGKYKPESFLMVLPRHQLIQWAERHQRQNSASS